MEKGLVLTKNLVGIFLAAIKSFFLAVTQAAWGLMAIVGLNAFIFYLYETKRMDDITSISPLFLKLEAFIGTHIMIFVYVFFVLYLYFEIKDVVKK